MHITLSASWIVDAPYHGLRMSAEEYFNLGESMERYELIDGIVCMSPSPTPLHQVVLTRLAVLIGKHLESNPVGSLFVELDVHFGRGPGGGDLVYRPDLMVLSSSKAAGLGDRVDQIPELVIEVISTTSRRQDTVTKRADYERFGVSEYWIIDPENRSITILRLRDGQYVEVEPMESRYESQAVAGLTISLADLGRLLAPP